MAGTFGNATLEGLNPVLLPLSFAFSVGRDDPDQSVSALGDRDQPTIVAKLKDLMKESPGWLTAHEAGFKDLTAGVPFVTAILLAIADKIWDMTPLGGLPFDPSDVLDFIHGLPALSDLIPGLDASKIISGHFAQSMIENLTDDLGDIVDHAQDIIDNIYQAIHGGSSTGNLVTTIKTALQNIPGPNVVTTLLSSIIPALDTSKITTGTFGDGFLPGLGSLRDAIGQAIDGGSTTGYTAANVKTKLQNIPGPNIVTSLLSSVIPALDTSKITTGTFGDGFLPGLGSLRDAIGQAVDGGSSTGYTAANVKTKLQNIPGPNILSTLGTTNFAQDVHGIVDGLVNRLRGESFSGWALDDAGDTLEDTAGSLAANTAAIAALNNSQTGADNGGQSVLVDFSQLPNGSLPGDFSITYSGSGTDTWSISSGRAKMSHSSGSDRTSAIRYTTVPTDTDRQKIGCAFSAAPRTGGFLQAGLSFIIGRCNSAVTSYVYLALGSNTIELGCVVSGVQTVFVPTSTYVFGFKPTAAYWLECGTTGGTRVFRVWENSTVLFSYTDSGNVSQLGASFRYTGFGGFMDAGTNPGWPGDVLAFAFSDNTPATLIGSFAKMSRTATGTVTFNSGTNLAPTSFFGVNDGATADITPDLTNGKFTVNTKGNYIVSIGYKIASGGMPGNTAIAPILYKNGSAHLGSGDYQQTQAGVTPVQIRSVSQTFFVDLDVNDTVQAGYNGTNSMTSSFTGEAAGLYSYFRIARMYP